MLLHELRLANIGVFRDEQRLEFSANPDQPITLIGGLNGCGKTTLLDSLQLVLYGNRARLILRDSGTYESYLKALSSRGMKLKERSSISLSFSVSSEGESLHYRVVRGWDPSSNRIQERLDVFVNGERSASASENWADLVEELLPLELSSLFFFDGEKIESLADPDQAASVLRTAVQALLGVSTLSRLRSDLLALQRRQLAAQEATEGGELLGQLSGQADALQLELDQLTQRKAEIESERRLEDRRLGKLKEELARRGGDLFKERHAIAERVAQLNQQASSVRNDVIARVEGSLPLSLVAGSLAEVMQEAQADLEAAHFDQLQETIARRDERILGCLDSEPLRNQIREFLQEDLSRMRESFVEPADSEVSVMDVSQLRQSVQLMEASKEALDSDFRQLDRIMIDLSLAESELAGVPEEDSISDVLESVRSAEETLVRMTGRLEEVNVILERTRLERERVVDAIRRVESDLIRSEVEEDDIRRILEHAERVRATLAKLEAALTERNLGRIEAVTMECLRRLMRKESLVQDLRVNPQSFGISLWTDADQEMTPAQLSAGERQLLATAILWALSRVAGSRVPTIIDTPLGRLDSVHRRQLVDNYFPVAGRQVVLLSTDEEIDEDLYSRLASAIDRSYLLEHDAESQTTAIIDGYWWKGGTPSAA